MEQQGFAGAVVAGHSFKINVQLQASLESEAQSLPNSKVTPKRRKEVVSENDAFMKAGRSPFDDCPLPSLQAEVVTLVHEGPSPIRFPVTEVCVANVDTVTAAVKLGDAAALNFASEFSPGGGYRSGSCAQEEDLCRLLPQLWHSIKDIPDYPKNGGDGLRPDTCLVTKGLQSVRQPFTYELCRCLGECAILTAAMPRCNGRYKERELLPETPPWVDTVTQRIRAVLFAAKRTCFPNLVLGAFGCGAFGNPPGPVAAVFKQQLQSAEFRGAFAKVVFAIIDPKKKGNIIAFSQAVNSMDQSCCTCCHGTGRILDDVCPLCDGLCLLYDDAE